MVDVRPLRCEGKRANATRVVIQQVIMLAELTELTELTELAELAVNRALDNVDPA